LNLIRGRSARRRGIFVSQSPVQPSAGLRRFGAASASACAGPGSAERDALAGRASLPRMRRKAFAPSASLGLPEATTRVKGPVPLGAGFRCQSLDTCGWASPRPTEDEDTQGSPFGACALCADASCLLRLRALGASWALAGARSCSVTGAFSRSGALTRVAFPPVANRRWVSFGGADLRYYSPLPPSVYPPLTEPSRGGCGLSFLWGACLSSVLGVFGRRPRWRAVVLPLPLPLSPGLTLVLRLTGFSIQ
jgi:hypothetical protein